MAHTTHAGAFGAFGLFSRVAEYRATWTKRVERYKRYRDTCAELRVLSDRELSDLGINRSMISQIARDAAYNN